MLKWALIFAVIAVIAGLLGFSGIAGAAAGIAKFLFVLALIIFLVFLALGVFAARKISGWARADRGKSGISCRREAVSPAQGSAAGGGPLRPEDRIVRGGERGRSHTIGREHV